MKLKLKLDENIGLRGVELLSGAGHDVATVRDQQLEGASDDVLFRVCAEEGRTLVTLDHDFGEILRFPPESSAGIVILELGPRATLASMHGRLGDFLALAETRSPVGELWIVQPGRVRLHVRPEEE
jgi:predicted nuclease of predicted toxin-antitoxin system